jgi:signal transduction histidine kinase
VLVVDDQVETLASVRLLLEREGHRVLTADSGARALDLLAREPVQVMLIDYFMPVMSGELLVRAVRERDTLVQIILQTGYAGEKPPREMLRRLAIQGYHDKADGPERLLLWVDVALKAYDQLARVRAAEQLKTELLASVSHEFRTPINVIIGYLDLVREGTFGACTAETLEVLEKVRTNAAFLLALVEEFLDLSRLEAGERGLQIEPIELPPLLRALGEAFGLIAATRRLSFVIDVPPDLPAVAADAGKLRVVIQNLLSNAAKFTPHGEVQLVARARPDGAVAVAVRDTGPGIAPEHHEAIFDLFHRLAPHDGATPGVGLGLALARRFARLMGGELTVDSALGAGATFTLVLPGVAAPAARGAA